MRLINMWILGSRKKEEKTQNLARVIGIPSVSLSVGAFSPCGWMDHRCGGAILTVAWTGGRSGCSRELYSPLVNFGQIFSFHFKEFRSVGICQFFSTYEDMLILSKTRPTLLTCPRCLVLDNFDRDFRFHNIIRLICSEKFFNFISNKFISASALVVLSIKYRKIIVLICQLPFKQLNRTSFLWDVNFIKFYLDPVPIIYIRH